MKETIRLTNPTEQEFTSLIAVTTFFETMRDPQADGEFIGIHIERTRDLLSRVLRELSEVAASGAHPADQE